MNYSNFFILPNSWEIQLIFSWEIQLIFNRWDGKCNLFSIAVHEIDHCIGLFHNTEDKDSIVQTIYKPGFSIENKTIYFLNLTYKQCKKCMAQQNM